MNQWPVLLLTLKDVNGKIFETFAKLPGDHWKTLGAEMQKYLGDQCTREELEESIETYWQKQ